MTRKPKNALQTSIQEQIRTLNSKMENNKINFPWAFLESGTLRNMRSLLELHDGTPREEFDEILITYTEIVQNHTREINLINIESKINFWFEGN